MPDTDMQFDIAGGVATLTLNRPGKRNAVTEAMWDALPGLLRKAEDAPAVHALVVTGAGGAFAAGADIGEFERIYATQESAKAYSATVSRALDALAGFPKPAVAKISGPCIGGGCGLALACDLRFADESAQFGITPAKLGLIYPLNDTKRLIEAVGVSAARDMLFTGRVMDAEEAKRLGLIDRLCAGDALEADIADWLTQARAASSYSAREMKRLIAMIQRGVHHETGESRQMFLDAFQGPHFAEGYRAFMEKRAPRFPED